MSVRMKALRPFGVRGANEGKIQRGREFKAATEQRARDLEAGGLAYRIEDSVRTQDVLFNKMEQTSPNKAADAGPLAFHGGRTGAETPASSLPPVQPQPKRRGRPPLNRSKEEPAY